MAGKDFKLFDAVVEVHCSNGSVIVEDFARRDSGAAREYASETAMCGDVVKTIFQGREYRNPALEKQK